MSTNAHCVAQMLQIVHHINSLLLRRNPYVTSKSTGISRSLQTHKGNVNNHVYVTTIQTHHDTITTLFLALSEYMKGRECAPGVVMRDGHKPHPQMTNKGMRHVCKIINIFMCSSISPGPPLHGDSDIYYKLVRCHLAPRVGVQEPW